MRPGQRIRELRQLSGLSQEELGKRVGVQRAAIQKYEKGTVENIPTKTIELIANVLGVSPTYIMGWDGFDTEKLTQEVIVLQGVKLHFGKPAVDLLECYTNSNLDGRQRLLDYACDIERLYKK